MSATALPPCGLYRTTEALEQIPAGKLVYFHNHGEPGPGVYLPSSWTQNRASFHARGVTLPNNRWLETLEPLAAEGFYRVRAAFHCCEKKCVQFEPEQLVQLGYNADAEAILFIPELRAEGLHIPDNGVRIDRTRLAQLAPLKVALHAHVEMLH